jgi:hypothetical protein
MKTLMTREAFLSEVHLLRDKGYEPHLEKDGIIVLTSPSGLNACVITAVMEMRTGVWFGMSEVSKAGQQLGLSTSLCERLVDANDFPEYGIWYRDQLRQSLLEALGLVTPMATAHAENAYDSTNGC